MSWATSTSPFLNPDKDSASRDLVARLHFQFGQLLPRPEIDPYRLPIVALDRRQQMRGGDRLHATLRRLDQLRGGELQVAYSSRVSKNLRSIAADFRFFWTLSATMISWPEYRANGPITLTLLPFFNVSFCVWSGLPRLTITECAVVGREHAHESVHSLYGRFSQIGEFSGDVILYIKLMLVPPFSFFVAESPRAKPTPITPQKVSIVTTATTLCHVRYCRMIDPFPEIENSPIGHPFRIQRRSAQPVNDAAKHVPCAR